jgi:hypothetical protein
VYAQVLGTATEGVSVTTSGVMVRVIVLEVLVVLYMLSIAFTTIV